MDSLKGRFESPQKGYWWFNNAIHRFNTLTDLRNRDSEGYANFRYWRLWGQVDSEYSPCMILALFDPPSDDYGVDGERNTLSELFVLEDDRGEDLENALASLRAVFSADTHYLDGVRAWSHNEWGKMEPDDVEISENIASKNLTEAGLPLAYVVIGYDQYDFPCVTFAHAGSIHPQILSERMTEVLNDPEQIRVYDVLK